MQVVYTGRGNPIYFWSRGHQLTSCARYRLQFLPNYFRSNLIRKLLMMKGPKIEDYRFWPTEDLSIHFGSKAKVIFGTMGSGYGLVLFFAKSLLKHM